MDEQPSPLSAPPRRLLRSRHDRMVAGVCGGLAEYTGIDPVVFRIVFAVAALAGGSGLIAYLVAWVVVPERPADGSEPPRRSLGGPDNVAAVVVGVLGVLVLLRILGNDRGPFDGDGGLLLLVLVGFGVWWWVRQEREGEPAAAAPSAAGDADGDPHLFAPAPPSPPPRSRRSRLPLVGVSALLLLWGALLLTDLVGIDVDGQVAIGLSLALVGGFVLLGARFGRPGGLVVVGVVLAAVGGLLSVLDAPFRGGMGERSWIVEDAGDLERSYRLGAGEAVLDLGSLDLRGEREDIAVSVGAGALIVVVPDDVDLVIDARVGIGELTVLGRTEDGVAVERVVREGGDVGAGLTITARVGMGELEVRRDAS